MKTKHTTHSEQELRKAYKQMRKADISDQEYASIHSWLKYNHEKPQKCEQCGTTDKKIAWALLHGKVYAKDRESFIGLCYSCHMKYDWGNYCARGHLYTEENTLWNTNDRATRRCRACNSLFSNEYQKSHREKLNNYVTTFVGNHKGKGLCVSCKEPLAANSIRYCVLHALKNAQHNTEYRRNKKLAKLAQKEESK